MPRSISLVAKTYANEENPSNVPVVLLNITHVDLPGDVIRISSDPTVRLNNDPLTYGTISRGFPYLYIPFAAVLPDDKEDAPPVGRLMVDNIYRELIPLLRSYSTPAKVTMEIVMASTPDFVEAAWADFDLLTSSFDQASVTISLGVDALQNEPFPSDTLNPSTFPGLF
jgi:hypothetical protein